MGITVLTVDYETFFDSKNGYTLRKQTMEEYLLDHRYRTHGAAVKVNDGPSEFMSRKELSHFFGGIDWDRTVFVAHNCIFDGAITAWFFGHRPRFYCDTRGIANAFIRPYTGRADLDSCCRFLNLPLKSSILKQCDGLSMEQIIAQGYYDAYASYACQDNDNCYAIFKSYYSQMLHDERIKMDWTIRNFTRGRLRLDVKLLDEAIVETEREREELLADLGMVDPKRLRSAAKFAEYLESLGIKVHYKDNKKGDGEIPAISKKDPFVRELLNHPDPIVVNAIKARLAFSSSIDLTRAQRLRKMAVATGGKMLIPMLYHAAHTGRPGGTEAVNVTNFKKPKPGERALTREAIHCQPGDAMVDADASQIEARLCAWLSGCTALTSAFAAGVDVYCKYGTEVVYRRVITKADEIERQICKVEVLSLQYGVGGDTLYERLQADGIALDLADAHQHVQMYRYEYPEMLANGAEFCDLLRWAIQTGKQAHHKGFVLAPEGIRLPSTRWLLYDKLQLDGREIVYYSHRYKSWQKLYPGSMNENLCQSMANDIVGAVHAKHADDVVFMIYDSVVRLCKAVDAQRIGEETVAELSAIPDWAWSVSDVPLPLKAEFKVKHHL